MDGAAGEDMQGYAGCGVILVTMGQNPEYTGVSNEHD